MSASPDSLLPNSSSANTNTMGASGANLPLNCANLERLQRQSSSSPSSTTDEDEDLLASILSHILALKTFGKASEESLRKSLCFVNGGSVRCKDNADKLNDAEFLDGQLEHLSEALKNLSQGSAAHKPVRFDSVTQAEENQRAKTARNFNGSAIKTWVNATQPVSSINERKGGARRGAHENRNSTMLSGGASDTTKVAKRRYGLRNGRNAIIQLSQEGKKAGHHHQNIASLGFAAKSTSTGSIILGGRRRSARIAAKSQKDITILNC